MADYIEREALLFDLKTSFVPQSTTYTDAVGIAMRWIKQAPAADVAHAVHGRWEITEDEFYMGLTICKCTACREEFCFEDVGDIENLNYNYCPNCGAKMDGDT